jgi:hypothetical protein
MKVLVVGSGGREHAIALEVKKSPLCSELICAPGNPGMAQLAECVAVQGEDLEGIAALVQARAALDEKRQHIEKVFPHGLLSTRSFAVLTLAAGSTGLLTV